MRLFALTLTACLIVPFTVMAQAEPSSIRAAADREARQLASSSTAQQPGTPAASDRAWISRHPVLLGTLIGAGGGAIMSLTMENEMFCSGGDEDCFFHGGSRVWMGAAMGAGVGALVGWIAGAARSDRGSPDRQITRSRDRRITRSPDRQITRSPDREIARF